MEPLFEACRFRLRVRRAEVWLRIASLATTLVADVPPAAAHHAFSSEYDATRPKLLTGTITRMEWVNPHARIHIAVKQSDNTTEQWTVEVAPPNALLRAGLRKPDLLVGTVIKVDGFEAKDLRMHVHGVFITLPDGRKIFLSSPINLGDEERLTAP